MSIIDKIKKINFRQPKYIIPTIVFPIVLFTGLFAFEFVNSLPGRSTVDSGMRSTDYLNSELPEAELKGDGIGGRYESMVGSYGYIQDSTVVENVSADEDTLESYESLYDGQEESAVREQAQLVEEQERLNRERDSIMRRRQEDAVKELERAVAAQRLRDNDDSNSKDSAAVPAVPVLAGTPVSVDSIAKGAARLASAARERVDANVRRSLDEDAEAQDAVKKVRPVSSYFNTVTENERESRLIQAIIDENVKAVDGSRVRLRLLDDIVVNGVTIKKGTCLYATMSDFGSQRVKGTVESALVDDNIVRLNLSIYDSDGIEGLYVPSSSFRETAQDVASGVAGSTASINTSTSSSLSQWGMQAVQKAYQKTSNAISKAIKKNRVSLKYGTFVYLVNGRQEGLRAR